MSTTVTLRPSVLFMGGVSWTFGGGATTIYGALSDDSDSTYTSPPDNTHLARLQFPTMTTVPVGAQIRTVRVRLRVSGNGSALFTSAIYQYGSTKSYTLTAGSKPGSSATTITYPTLSKDLNGNDWTVDRVHQLAVQIAGSASIKFIEMYLDVVYNEIPVVSSVAPSGSITTQTPTISWTWTDPDGDAQDRYYVKIFTQAATLVAGFSPDYAASSVNSGTVYSADTQWVVTTALPSGVYWAYVKAADSGSNGRFSAWSSSTFTVAGDPPNAPVLVSATADPTVGRVALVVRQQDNMLAVQQATGDATATTEPVRWVGVTNTGTPAVNSSTGVVGNSIRFTVTSAGAATVRTTGTGINGIPVSASLAVAWSGKVKAGSAAGTSHLDLRVYDSSGTDLGTTGRVGSTVTNSTSYQTSSGTATLPANAAYVALEWVLASATAGQVYDVDVNEVRYGSASSGGRGGLDSHNLFGPRESTFDGGTVGNWAKTSASTGTVAQAADTATFAGQHLEYQPGTVGATHVLTVGTTYPLPVVGGELLSSATYQFHFSARANVASLKVDYSILWYDDLSAQVGSSYGGQATLASSSAFTSYYMSVEAPSGATRWSVQLVLTGETATTDRWIFDRFGFGRVPALTSALQAWRPSQGVNPYPYVEYTDNSTDWYPVRFTQYGVFDPVTRLATVYDYEAPSNTARTYRARTGALDYQIDSVSGAAVLSSASSTLAATLAVSDFYVVDPYGQARVRLPIIGDVVVSSDEPQGVFQPLGRTNAVVLSDTPKGETFSFQLGFNGVAEWSAFEALRQSQRVLYLQTPGSSSYYVKLGGPRVSTWYGGTVLLTNGGLYRVEVPATEVDRPN